MKTKAKKKKSIMQELREIRDKLSLEIKDMSHEELLKFLNRPRNGSLFSKEK